MTMSRKLARNYLVSDLRFDFLSLVVSDLVKMGETSGKQGPKHMHIYKPDYKLLHAENWSLHSPVRQCF